MWFIAIRSLDLNKGMRLFDDLTHELPGHPARAQGFQKLHRIVGGNRKQQAAGGLRVEEQISHVFRNVRHKLHTSADELLIPLQTAGQKTLLRELACVREKFKLF